MTTALQRGLNSVDDIVAHANDPAITHETVRHILRGDSGGRHHITAIINDNVRRLVDRVSETSDGFYGAIFSTSGRKSFFPDTWSEYRVMDELKHVMNNSIRVSISGTSEIWRGTTTGGQVVEYIRFANNGRIITAYPILNNFP